MIEMRWKAESICHRYLSPIFAEFNGYLTMNIKKGRIRNLDPTMITAALGMSALVHPLLSRLLTGGPPPHTDNRDAIQAYSNFWLSLLTATSNDNSREEIAVASSGSGESELSVD